MKQTILDNIRRALGREAGAAVAARPQVYPPRAAGTPESEIERFLAELKLLSADGQALAGESALQAALHALVQAEQVRKATLWSTPLLRHLRLAERLQALGVELVSPQAGKLALAGCDLGVTEADFALPETGTRGLRSSTKKPRAVSLVPRIHLALLTPEGLAQRAAQIAELEARYGKASHREALESTRLLVERQQALVPRRGGPLAAHVFQADALSSHGLPARFGERRLDMVITDIPYGLHSNWHSGAAENPPLDPVQQMLDALAALLAQGGVAAVASPKQVAVGHPRYRQAGKLKLGKRQVVFLSLAE